MSPPRTVAVLGLGLMGGSLARELAARGVRVLGYDRDPATLEAALAEGVLHRALPSPAEGLGEAELLVLAVPVTAAEPLLEQALPGLRPDCVLTDLGSTKRAVERTALRLGVAERFVGAHPLAGDHRAGWTASRTGLFAGARVFVCPTPRTRAEALAAVRGLWSGLGAALVQTTAEEHDRALAWTSHLPQITSTALGLALHDAGFLPRDLGPGGRDATRLAGSSPEMWTAICRENADLLEPALQELAGRIDEVRGALRQGDAEAVRLFFTRGGLWATS